MRLKGLTAVLIGLSVLCLAGCASTRQASSSSSALRVLSQESEQVRAESSELARDTLIEVTTVTVQLNEVGDTVKTSTVTDRTRARAYDRRKDVEIRTEIVRDTVYIEKIDSVYVQNTNGFGGLTTGLTNPTNKKNTFVSSLKWIFWILVAGIVLIVVLRFGRLLKC